MKRSGEHKQPQEEQSRAQDEHRRPQSLLKLTNLLIDSNKTQSEPDLREQTRNREKIQRDEETWFLANLEKEQKRMMTLERNRLAAIRSRKKKKQELDMLIGSIRQLEKSESFLDAALRNLENEKSKMMARLSLDLDHLAKPQIPQVDNLPEDDANKDA